MKTRRYKKASRRKIKARFLLGRPVAMSDVYERDLCKFVNRVGYHMNSSAFITRNRYTNAEGAHRFAKALVLMNGEFRVAAATLERFGAAILHAINGQPGIARHG